MLVLTSDQVYDEINSKLKEVGISDYSVFRRGQDLTLVLRTDDFDKASDELDKAPVNQRCRSPWAVSSNPSSTSKTDNTSGW